MTPCPIHGTPLRCLSCVAAKGGATVTPAKSASSRANAAKASAAIRRPDRCPENCTRPAGHSGYHRRPRPA